MQNEYKLAIYREQLQSTSDWIHWDQENHSVEYIG